MFRTLFVFAYLTNKKKFDEFKGNLAPAQSDFPVYFYSNLFFVTLFYKFFLFLLWFNP